MAQRQVPAPIQSNRCRDLFQVNQTITLLKLSSFQTGRRLSLREKHVADRHAHQYDTSNDGHDDAGVLPGKAVLGHVLDQDACISPDDHQPREFDTYESKKHPESPIGLIFFVKFIGYILRDLA